MSGELIPPAVIEIVGDDAGFIATIAKDTGILAEWAKTTTNTNLGAESGDFQATLTTVKTELLDLAKQVTNANLGADATQFWTEIAALRTAVDAMSPIDINVDANISEALAQIAVLKGAAASAQVGMLADAAGAGGAGGGGAGSAGLLGLLGGGGGGGGGGLMSLLGFGGLGGLASFGTLGSLMGGGIESMLTTALGVAGSAAGGLAGGAALGLGTLGVAGVGMGTDMAGMGQAAGDIKSVYSAQQQLNQAMTTYQAVAAQYGASSAQAASALLDVQNAQVALTTATTSFSPAAQTAVVAAAQTAVGFRAMFDQVTGAAESTGANIINQLMQVGEKFLPTIGTFASQNMTIIQASLQPLLTWIQGPGLSIFRELEQTFQTELPTAMVVFDNGVELLIKVLGFLAPYTGKLIDDLAKWTTELNGADFGTLTGGINSIIGIFRDWEGLIKAVATAIYELFSHDAGTGTSLVVSLTNMVNKFNDWVRTVAGGDQLHSLLESHKDEILAIVTVLGDLIGAWGKVELMVRPILMDLIGLLASMANILLNMPVVGTIAALVIAFEVFGSKIGPLNGLLTSFNGWLKNLALDGVQALGAALVDLGGPFTGLGTWMEGLGTESATAGETAAAAMQVTAESIAESTAAIATYLGGAGTAFGAMAADAEAAASTVDLASAQMRGGVLLGGATAGVGAEAGAAGGVTAEEATTTETALGGSAVAAGTLSGLIGPISIALGVAAASADSLYKSFTSTSTAANATTTAITNMKPSASIAGLQSQMAYLQQQIAVTKTSLANVPSPGFSLFSGLLGEANGEAKAYNSTLDLENKKLATVGAALSVASANTAILSHATGLSTPIVASLAQQLGINLTQALNPSKLETMTNYIKQQGGAAAVTGQEWTASGEAIAAAAQLAAARVAAAMPEIPAATRNMINQVQPNLVSLVGDLQKTGDSSGAEFVSAFVAHLSPAQLASKQMHDGTLSPLEPLVSELQTIGDTSAADMIAKFIGHQSAASTASKSMAQALTNPLTVLESQLSAAGDAGAAALVAEFIKHNPAAATAAGAMHDAITGKLNPLITDLPSIGQSAATNMITAFIAQEQSAASGGQAVGAALAAGVGAGLASSEAVAGVVAGATNLVTIALASAKKAGGITSPSALFAAELGVPLAQGVAVGLLAGASGVNSAAETLVRGAAGVRIPGSTGSGVAGSGLTLSPTYHVTINAAGGNPQQVGTALRKVLQQHDDELARRLSAGSISSAGG